MAEAGGTAVSVRARRGMLLAGVVGGLLVLHFLLRPLFTGWPVSPDLLAGALLLATLRLRAGHAAALGFSLGLLEGAMALSGVGWLAVSYGLAAYAAVRSWELVFTDERSFLPVYLLAGVWLLDVLTVALTGGGLGWGFVLLRAPAEAVLTAVVCVPLGRLVSGPAL